MLEPLDYFMANQKKGPEDSDSDTSSDSDSDHENEAKPDPPRPEVAFLEALEFYCLLKVRLGQLESKWREMIDKLLPANSCKGC